MNETRNIEITPRTAQLLEVADRTMGRGIVDLKLDRLLLSAIPEDPSRVRWSTPGTTIRGINQLAYTKRSHYQRRAAGICINAKAGHGPVYRGGRCEACWEKKKKGENRPGYVPREKISATSGSTDERSTVDHGIETSRAPVAEQAVPSQAPPQARPDPQAERGVLETGVLLPRDPGHRRLPDREVRRTRPGRAQPEHHEPSLRQA